jgi:hypothetical protein
LICGTIPEPQASACLRELAGLIERGAWPNWDVEWQAVEDQVCAACQKPG